MFTLLILLLNVIIIAKELYKAKESKIVIERLKFGSFCDFAAIEYDIRALVDNPSKYGLQFSHAKIDVEYQDERMLEIRGIPDVELKRMRNVYDFRSSVRVVEKGLQKFLFKFDPDDKVVVRVSVDVETDAFFVRVRVPVSRSVEIPVHELVTGGEGGEGKAAVRNIEFLNERGSKDFGARVNLDVKAGSVPVYLDLRVPAMSISLADGKKNRLMTLNTERYLILNNSTGLDVNFGFEIPFAAERQILDVLGKIKKKNLGLYLNVRNGMEEKCELLDFISDTLIPLPVSEKRLDLASKFLNSYQDLLKNKLGNFVKDIEKTLASKSLNRRVNNKSDDKKICNKNNKENGCTDEPFLSVGLIGGNVRDNVPYFVLESVADLGYMAREYFNFEMKNEMISGNLPLLSFESMFLSESGLSSKVLSFDVKPSRVDSVVVEMMTEIGISNMTSVVEMFRREEKFKNVFLSGRREENIISSILSFFKIPVGFESEGKSECEIEHLNVINVESTNSMVTVDSRMMFDVNESVLSESRIKLYWNDMYMNFQVAGHHPSEKQELFSVRSNKGQVYLNGDLKNVMCLVHEGKMEFQFQIGYSEYDEVKLNKLNGFFQEYIFNLGNSSRHHSDPLPHKFYVKGKIGQGKMNFQGDLPWEIIMEDFKLLSSMSTPNGKWSLITNEINLREFYSNTFFMDSSIKTILPIKILPNKCLIRNEISIPEISIKFSKYNGVEKNVWQIVSTRKNKFPLMLTSEFNGKQKYENQIYEKFDFKFEILDFEDLKEAFEFLGKEMSVNSALDRYDFSNLLFNPFESFLTIMINNIFRQVRKEFKNERNDEFYKTFKISNSNLPFLSKIS
ncbi:hypothetical protein ROZALSC1DRAFT_27460, partial [Rozella allomycis CSF55]